MAAITVALLVAAGIEVTAALPAMAANSSPLAIGPGAATDNRVWEVVGTAVGQRVRVSPYRVGYSGTTVDNQRWRLETMALYATSIGYRIRNIASNRCLQRNASNHVVLAECVAATPTHAQRWAVSVTDDPYGGWQLRNGANNQCLSIAGGSSASGALLQTAACADVTHQRWRLRHAPQDCTVRSRDWTRTDVCTSLATGRRIGVTANWTHNPVSMSWLDPSLYILSHTANTYTEIRPLNPDYSQGTTRAEFGRRAQRSAAQTGGVTYWAYWLESNGSTEQYHPLTADQAPRANLADSGNHTYMLLGNGDAGQWDLLYDYNVVGTTALQSGGSTRNARGGLAIRYPQATTMATPVQLRMQLMDPNGVWRRPYLGETGTGQPKDCEAPPRDEDYGYDTVNRPPNCFTAGYSVRAGATATDPVELDTFTIGKPAATTALTQHVAAAGAPSSDRAVSGVHNGVDQRELAACIADGSRDCLAEVPNLAACVEARAICNIAGQQARMRAAASPMTATEAMATAKAALPIVAPAEATVTTRQQAEGDVYVVTSAARVRSMSASDDTIYTGYEAVFEVASGRMISARLGAAGR